VIGAFLRAAAQLTDSALRRIVWRGLLLSAAVLALIWGGVGALLAYTTFFQLGWLNTATDVLGGLATVVLTWLFFPAVVTSVLGFFLEDAADAVERRYYQHLSPPRRQPFAELVVSSLKLLASMAVLNLVALLFLLLPPVFPFVFYGVNGYLLGREYFEVVAFRRLDPPAAAALRRRYRGTVFLTGVIIAFLLTVPVVNLIAPVLGAAAMVHVYHGLLARPTSADTLLG
jgi:uncharacterized protein involved in cysteine biosynthesis